MTFKRYKKKIFCYVYGTKNEDGNNVVNDLTKKEMNQQKHRKKFSLALAKIN